ncbi:conserved hypothetical protein [Ricinus communis]|uniref:Uncharacterized protein n=1 Tax=Ricinus communis TaxID=3988 RepID=B9SD03_RICCO|nr:conserved hypothetical protein [Ricinus communis]|eukprot:XP_002523872.1 NDR1/HIN1-like protein 10 [Ricinus communis]
MAQPHPYSGPVTGYPAPTSQHPFPNGNPYAPPPTNLYYYNHQTPTPLYRTTLLRRIIAAIIVATVLFFTIFLICWLVIRPHRPQFHITSFSISNFNISASSQRLTANWNARFQVYNPNKKLKISYDNIVCSLLLKSELLSQTRIPPLYQDTKNLTSLDASFSALDTYVDDRVLKDINAARPTLAFNVRLMADVGFKVGGFRARHRLLRVWCDNVPLSLSSATSGSGNLTGGSRECKVYA